MEKPQEIPAPELPERRDFLKKAAAVGIGTVAALVPAVPGVFVLLDPLKRRGDDSQMIFVASLNALPEDGTPRKFPVLASHVDAWTRIPETPVGAVYLRRIGSDKVQAFNVICPHAGCPVDFKAERKGYHCPCHDSTFALDGKRSPKSPSPRDLDDLQVEIRNQREIWVKFQNFQAGHAEKIPLA
ncbi:MAG: Rieske 2Fe-2S domain-containing protein [Verrucomicrobiota bacterium]|jgi:menaquinol-cytochrome c reductase iron-sulfur subunit